MTTASFASSSTTLCGVQDDLTRAPQLGVNEASASTSTTTATNTPEKDRTYRDRFRTRSPSPTSSTSTVRVTGETDPRSQISKLRYTLPESGLEIDLLDRRFVQAYANKGKFLAVTQGTKFLQLASVKGVRIGTPSRLDSELEAFYYLMVWVLDKLKIEMDEEVSKKAEKYPTVPFRFNVPAKKAPLGPTSSGQQISRDASKIISEMMVEIYEILSRRIVRNARQAVRGFAARHKESKAEVTCSPTTSDDETDRKVRTHDSESRPSRNERADRRRDEKRVERDFKRVFLALEQAMSRLAGVEGSVFHVISRRVLLPQTTRPSFYAFSFLT